MIDVTTKKPLRVQNDGNAGPYIFLPEAQLDEVQALLERHGIPFSIEEELVSLDNGPYIATIDFQRDADPHAIQEILDRAN